MAIQKAIQKSGILSPWRNPLDPGDRFYRRVSAVRSYVAPVVAAANRIFHPVLSREGRHYTMTSSVVSGDWSMLFEGYLIGAGSNASPAGAIISGWADQDNYFLVGLDDEGRLVHEHCVAGLVTTSTCSFLYSLYEMDWFRVSRVGSELSIETLNRIEKFTVPDADFVIDSIMAQVVDGSFSNPATGSVKRMEFNAGSSVLIDSDFDDDLSSGSGISNAGSLSITAVNIPSSEVITFNIAAGALLWDAAPFNHLGSNYDLTLSSESQGNIVGGTTNYNNRVVDGVFTQRFEAVSNTTTGGIKIVYGYNGPTLDVGETGPVTYNAANTGRVYYTSLADANTGAVNSLSATPIMSQADPRELYTIVHLGDSITNYMVHENQGVYIDLAESYNGIKLHVINEGVGGHTIIQMRDRLPAILADQAGKKRVLIVIMAGSNWVDGHTVEDYDAVLRQMVADVYAAGFECAVMNKTANVNNTTMADEPGVNTESNNVVCRELTPAWYDFGTGRPMLDGFSILLGGQNESPSLFRDNLHPSEEGEQVLINNVAPIIADRVWRLFEG